ncbi:hypothetical protein [Allisonella histaminiformans]|uniref:hypothetical protein n=1 Tax=Allisonella histaminiformans TaxID=209880 RepID=UPI002E75BFBA|nr:hypothetical protein [Allisonella histaminiformans]
MGKHGMQRRVYKNADPVFDTVLGKFRKEARLAAEQKRSMAAFRVLATCRKIISIAGYRLASGLVIEDKKTGARYGRY